jgi:hypothetical protein
MYIKISILAFTILLVVQTDACIQKFKRAADMATFSLTCFKVGFEKVPTLEEMQKSDFDDKVIRESKTYNNCIQY